MSSPRPLRTFPFATTLLKVRSARVNLELAQKTLTTTKFRCVYVLCVWMSCCSTVDAVDSCRMIRWCDLDLHCLNKIRHHLRGHCID
jgi:hypothetical protein